MVLPSNAIGNITDAGRAPNSGALLIMVKIYVQVCVCVCVHACVYVYVCVCVCVCVCHTHTHIHTLTHTLIQALGDMFNHSCQPNSHITLKQGLYCLTAISNIRKGAEACDSFIRVTWPIPHSCHDAYAFSCVT